MTHEWANMETRMVHTWLTNAEYVDSYIKGLIERARKSGNDTESIAKTIGEVVEAWSMPLPGTSYKGLNYESLCQGVAEFFQKVDFRQIVEAYMEKGESS